MTYADYERKAPPAHPRAIHEAIDGELTGAQFDLLKAQEVLHKRLTRLVELRNDLHRAAGFGV